MIIPCTPNDQSIIATLKLQITICLHPCHRQRRAQHSRQTVSRESCLVLVLCLWLVWDVWVCLSKFLASLLSCLSWQLSFPGPGLVIVMAAPSLIISSSASVLSILLAINQVTWSWSDPRASNIQCPDDFGSVSNNSISVPPWPAPRVPGAHFIIQLPAVINFYFHFVVFIFSNLYQCVELASK